MIELFVGSCGAVHHERHQSRLLFIIILLAQVYIRIYIDKHESICLLNSFPFQLKIDSVAWMHIIIEISRFLCFQFKHSIIYNEYLYECWSYNIAFSILIPKLI